MHEEKAFLLPGAPGMLFVRWGCIECAGEYLFKAPGVVHEFYGPSPDRPGIVVTLRHGWKTERNICLPIGNLVVFEEDGSAEPTPISARAAAKEEDPIRQDGRIPAGSGTTSQAG